MLPNENIEIMLQESANMILVRLELVTTLEQSKALQPKRSSLLSLSSHLNIAGCLGIDWIAPKKLFLTFFLR